MLETFTLGLEEGIADGGKLGLSLGKSVGLVDGNLEDRAVGLALGVCDDDPVGVPGGTVARR